MAGSEDAYISRDPVNEGLVSRSPDATGCFFCNAPFVGEVNFSSYCSSEKQLAVSGCIQRTGGPLRLRIEDSVIANGALGSSTRGCWI